MRKIVKTNGPISEEMALSVVGEIADALDHAWREFGIIHRNIKPSKIVIRGNGGALLEDMSLSKSWKEDSESTYTRGFVGTLSYASPKRAKGDMNINCQSDIYSMGATLFYAATGRRPLNSTTNESPRDLRAFNSNISANFSKMVQKMMEAEPNKRQADWREVIADIKRVSNGKAPKYKKWIFKLGFRAWEKITRPETQSLSTS